MDKAHIVKPNDPRVYRKVPTVYVSFHTKNKCYHTRGKVGKIGTDPTAQVISVSTQKTLDNPAGAFTVRLQGTGWLNKLSTNDLVVIQMGYLGDGKHTIMVGLIDRIQQSRSMAGEEPVTVTQVIGRDFGKLLIESNLKFYPEIGVSKNSDFILTKEGKAQMLGIFTSNEIVKGSPAVLMDTVMRHLFMKLYDVDWYVYDERSGKRKTVSAGNILRYTFEQVDLFLPMMLTADQFEGSLWNIMEKMAPKPFFELIVDVRKPSEVYKDSGNRRLVSRRIEERSSKAKGNLPRKKGRYPYPAVQFGQDKSKVVFALRTTPFSSSDKGRLIKHRVTALDVIEENLTKSDDEHYNLFWAGTVINPLGIDLKRIFPPMLNEKNAKRYGLQPLEVEIQGLSIDRSNESKSTVVLSELSNRYTSKLRAWFENNHEYLSGTLETVGIGDIKVGQLIEYTPLDSDFYVEGVSHNFTVYEGWTTTSSVTRGMATNSKINPSSYERKIPKPKPKPQPAKPASRHHIVVKGDTLWDLAGKYYSGKGHTANLKWRKIWEANKEMMIKRDPRNRVMHGHWIYPGQRLRIPPE